MILRSIYLEVAGFWPPEPVFAPRSKGESTFGRAGQRAKEILKIKILFFPRLRAHIPEKAAKRRQQTDAMPIAAAASRLNVAICRKLRAEARSDVRSRFRREISRRAFYSAGHAANDKEMGQ
jgi:hypothetical protein